MPKLPLLAPAPANPKPGVAHRRGRPKRLAPLIIPTNISSVPAAPSTANMTNTTPETKPVLPPKSKRKIKTEQISLLNAELAMVRAQNDALRAEKFAMSTQISGLQHENVLLKEDATSLLREKGALQRVVEELGKATGGMEPAVRARSLNWGKPDQNTQPTRDADGFSDFIVNGQDTTEAPAAPPEYLWDPQQDINRILKVLFTSPPLPVHIPGNDLMGQLAVHQQRTVAVMVGLGHSVAGVHAGVPVFHPGPFLQCPSNPGPIFAMYQWNLRFFHGGCVRCRATNSECPLSGQEFYYLRLRYEGATAVVWVPDYWVTRVLCRATIP